MVVVDRPPANGFVAFARRIYNPVGYAKGYNFVLWFILAGAMMGFVLARFMFLDVDGIFCAREDNGQPQGTLPAECYYYQGTRSRGRIGILLHLSTILPAGFLVVFQFVPVIRHKLILFHRINGYVICVLVLISTAGVLMIARHSFGGGFDTQVAAGLASIIFVGSKIMAIYNIKRLQIEQHRAWMLRAWISGSFIITMRLISAIMGSVISSMNEHYYLATPCYIIDYTFKGNQTRVLDSYPGCSTFYDGSNHEMRVVVTADSTSPDLEKLNAGFLLGFGAAGWLALAIHVFGVELYLRLTPAEGERLRRISYQRQLEAGMRNPGNAGLTVERLGDAEPWLPPVASSTVVAHEKTSGSNHRDSNEISM